MKFMNKELIEVEEHTKCKCDCKKKESDCSKFQRYNKAQCLCVCINIEDKNKCLTVRWMDPLFDWFTRNLCSRLIWLSFSFFSGDKWENVGSRQLHVPMSWSKRLLHRDIFWFKYLLMPRGTSHWNAIQFASVHNLCWIYLFNWFDNHCKRFCVRKFTHRVLSVYLSLSALHTVTHWFKYLSFLCFFFSL